MKKALLMGCGIVLLQFLFVCATQGRWPSFGTWKNLYQWDSHHYAELADTGYYSKLPVYSPGTELTKFSFEKYTNVAFFPGYPLAARGFIRLGLPREFALLLTAAIAAVAFWTYLLLLCGRLGLSRWWTATVAIAIVAHPAAFTLIAAYSESLFLAALLGMIFWMTSGKRHSAWIAAAHGFVLSLTRVFGLALMMLPLLLTYFRRRPRRRELLIAGATAFGAFSFFLYCRIAFGWALLYFARQQIGWDLRPDYLLLWNPRFTSLFFPYWWNVRELSFQAVNPFIVPLTLWLLLMTTALCGWRTLQRQELPPVILTLLGAGWILFYLAAAALINLWWRSMMRYTFPVYVCVLICLWWALQPLAKSRTLRGVFSLCFGIFTLGLGMLQWFYAGAFTRGDWTE